jgi:hypothetical protein
MDGIAKRFLKGSALGATALLGGPLLAGLPVISTVVGFLGALGPYLAAGIAVTVIDVWVIDKIIK